MLSNEALLFGPELTKRKECAGGFGECPVDSMSHSGSKRAATPPEVYREQVKGQRGERSLNSRSPVQ